MSFLITSDPECNVDQTIRGLRVTFACLQNEDSEQTRHYSITVLLDAHILYLLNH